MTANSWIRVSRDRVSPGRSSLLVNFTSDEAKGHSGFLEMKAAREEMELASRAEKTEVFSVWKSRWAKRGCRARSTKQRARLDRLETLKNGAAPVRDQTVEIDSSRDQNGQKDH